MCKGETLLGIVKNFWKQKVYWQHPEFILFPPIIWIFTEDEGDGIESGLPS